MYAFGWYLLGFEIETWAMHRLAPLRVPLKFSDEHPRPKLGVVQLLNQVLFESLSVDSQNKAFSIIFDNFKR